MFRETALSLVVLLAVFEAGTCLQCYKCTTDNDGASCGVPFTAKNKKVGCGKVGDSTSTLSITGDNTKYLKKFIPEIENLADAGATQYCLKFNAPNFTARTCVYATNELQIKTICTAAGPDKSCQYCTTDLCNGSSSSSAIGSSITVAILTIVATYLFY